MRIARVWSEIHTRAKGPYGVVVLSVKVSVLLYDPVRSASPAATSWARLIATGSLATGPAYVSTVSGEPETAPAGAAVPPIPLVAEAFRAAGSENAPLTRWPGAVVLGSVIDSAASP